MPNSGWRVTLSADLQHWAALATRDLAFVPGWAFAALAPAAVALLIRRARRHTGGEPAPGQTPRIAAPEPDPAPGCCVAPDPAATPIAALITESAHGQ